MRDNVIFFRSLQVMFGAGISLHSALGLLATSAETPVRKALYKGMADSLARGSSLSESMSSQTRAFERYQIALIRVGEGSGSLARILQSLSDQMEKSWALKRKLYAGLTYPSVLISGCLLMLVLAPSFLLDGPIRMLTDSGVPLPPLTQALLLWSRLLKPLPVLVILAAAGGLFWKLWQEDRFWEKAHSAMRRAPGLGRILCLANTARFARCLAISLRAGVNLLEALRLSSSASGDPGLIEAASQTADAVADGETLGKAMLDTGYFLGGFPELIYSGEMVGRIDILLELGADFCEQELDLTLASLSTLLEPVLLLGIGVITAFMLVAVLQPTLSLLQSL